jgi:hypothetical protein
MREVMREVRREVIREAGLGHAGSGSPLGTRHRGLAAFGFCASNHPEALMGLIGWIPREEAALWKAGQVELTVPGLGFTATMRGLTPAMSG